MKAQKINTSQDDLFKTRLSSQLNPRDPLFILSHQINWAVFEEVFGVHFPAGPGQPPKPIRLIVGLLMLEHMHGLSDDQVVLQWVQNPYWQYFCGYDHLQWQLPVDSSSLTRWRARLGQEGLEKILSETIATAVRTKTVAPSDLKKVIADTTVMEKNVSYPTDSKLLNRAREQLVRLASHWGVTLRQTYARVGKRAALQAGRYAHAKQFKRMKKAVKSLKNYLGRTVRDIERQIKESSDLGARFTPLLDKAKRLLAQEKRSSLKLYSLHEPDVYCIAKGKAAKPYEFGCKVALIVTHKQGLALSSQALSTNVYDGHTLKASLQNASALAQATIDQAFVDKGYRGHEVEAAQVYISGQRRGLTRSLKKSLKRRSAIEPHIGHMKNTGKLRRNYLKGIIGDAFNALLCAIGHNLRMIRRTIRSLFVFFCFWLKSVFHQKINKAYL